MRVKRSRQADRDLLGIADYIARDNAARASSFVRELRSACARLGDMPAATLARPDLAPGLRMKAFGNYLIFLKIEGDYVLIVRVVHSARFLPAVFGNDADNTGD